MFVHARDLPAEPGPALDDLLLRLMGSPDPVQIDGLGGARSSTSKVIVVAPSAEPGVDVDYWFAQVSVDSPAVSWSGNCGNLTTAVGPFALDEGLAKAVGPTVTVRMRNRNTGVVVDSTFGVRAGRAETAGDCVVAGVPGSGAPVTTRYLDPVGGTLGSMFPTGSTREPVGDGAGAVEVSLLDVTHPYAFVRAADVGVDMATPVAELDGDTHLRDRLERIRGASAVALGLVADPTDAAARVPALPRLILVGPDDGRGGATGIRTVAVSMGRIHHALPMTGALCLGAAVACGAETLPSEFASCPDGMLDIRHPKGTTTVTVRTSGTPPHIAIESVGVVRTARRLLTGTAHLPRTD
ncbi:PrpF domain-containing protein [Pseudonocardia ailaonensis]|uniref:PrpF domain-containing protein n=1 Tax=Pseudonocardia ailaonensis TaxID=367279 RepID=A0ABN2N9J2_9PSEU